jgi:hypothetical protein
MATNSLDQAAWRKSSRSGNATAQCVEVAIVDDGVGVRDSKDLAGPRLFLGSHGWTAFISAIKAGDFHPRP